MAFSTSSLKTFKILSKTPAKLLSEESSFSPEDRTAAQPEPRRRHMRSKAWAPRSSSPVPAVFKTLESPLFIGLSSDDDDPRRNRKAVFDQLAETTRLDAGKRNGMGQME